MADPDDVDIDAISRRVRAAQRRNLMVKGLATLCPLVGIVGGIALNVAYPVEMRGGVWGGLIFGTMLGGVVYKKLEVPIPDLDD